MTDEFLKELYLKAYNRSPNGVPKHLCGLRAVRDHYADAAVKDFARTEVAAPDMISIAAIQEEIDHIQQNGIDVAKFGGQDLDEGRCRELCAMYLSEFILSHRLGQQLDALDAQRSKNQLAVAEANRRLDAAKHQEEPK